MRFFVSKLFLVAFCSLHFAACAQIDPFAKTKKNELLDESKTSTQKLELDANQGDIPDEAISELSADGVDTSVVQRLEIPAEMGQKTTNSAYDKFLQNELSSAVPILTCQQLFEMLQKRSNRNQLALLDGRSKDEYEVSHLQTAQRVGFKDFSNELVWSINRNSILVVYAASGQESEELGKRLKDMGFKNVYNLYGSIMEWVNQGYPIVDKNNQPTTKVHVGMKKRAKFLKKGKAVY